MMEPILDLRLLFEQRRKHWEAFWHPAFQALQELIDRQQKGRNMNKLELEIIDMLEEDVDPAMRAYQGMKNAMAKKFHEAWVKLLDNEVDGGMVLEGAVQFSQDIDDLFSLASDFEDFCRIYRFRLEAGPGDSTTDETMRKIDHCSITVAQAAVQAAEVLNNGIPPEYQITPEAIVDRIAGHARFRTIQ